VSFDLTADSYSNLNSFVRPPAIGEEESDRANSVDDIQCYNIIIL